MVKKILSILAWVITAAGIVVLFIFSRAHYMDTPLKSISVQIEKTAEKGFINHDTVIQNVNHICHLMPEANISSINMKMIQQYLTKIPWVEDNASYIDLNGVLNINLKEYEPVLRVFNTNGQSVYVTDKGHVVPTSAFYTPRVLIANGQFVFDKNKLDNDSLYKASHIDEALHIRKAIAKDPFLESCIGQIYRNRDGEFEIVVKEIASRIMVGDTTDIDDKLLRMKIFLQQKAGDEELQNYKKLNLKYKNQIVCTKKTKS